MAQNDVIIKIEHLSKSFGDKRVLNDINLEIKRGEFVTLLGPSGCGKTTMLRIIAGSISADEGIISMEGEDISGIPSYRRPFNTVFQRYALFPHLDVYDNIAFGLKLKKIPRDEIDRRVRKYLKMVNMSDYEDRDVESLSGGQQQRIAIARALVNQPQVLLLDEPLAALDLKMRKDMQMELKEMHRKLGITFIYVTHDQEEALTLSDTIVVMNEGLVQQIGTPTDIYNEPRNEFVADFIGESNILNGIIPCDEKVQFIYHDFDCVDRGFEPDEHVNVVIRPEDIYIFSEHLDKAQFTGVVQSCIFKGVHYEMTVLTKEGYEIMVQDYNAFKPGLEVGLLIRPDDIHVMHKECLRNSFGAEYAGDGKVSFLGGEWPVDAAINSELLSGAKEGESFIADVEFRSVELMDESSEGTVSGKVFFILYKGNHYFLTVKTESGDKVYVQTDDVWDKSDLVGIKISPENIRLRKVEEQQSQASK